MDTDKPCFSFRWKLYSIENIKSGKYKGNIVECTTFLETDRYRTALAVLVFVTSGRDEASFLECEWVADDGCVTIPSIIPFEDELQLSFRVVSIRPLLYNYQTHGKIKKIVIPDSVTFIGENTFYDCISLMEINIPDSVTSIGDHAFFRCKSLAKIIIPKSVISIGNSVFGDCTSLKEIYCLTTTPPEVRGFDLGLDKGDVTVYVPRESVELYHYTFGWLKYEIRPMPE